MHARETSFSGRHGAVRGLKFAICTSSIKWPPSPPVHRPCPPHPVSVIAYLPPAQRALVQGDGGEQRRPQIKSLLNLALPVRGAPGHASAPDLAWSRGCASRGRHGRNYNSRSLVFIRRGLVLLLQLRNTYPRRLPYLPRRVNGGLERARADQRVLIFRRRQVCSCG